MIVPDPDDQTWRITFVRLLLCILLLYYLATIVILAFVKPSFLTLRNLSPILAVLACLTFAAFALMRLRGEAIVAIATAALLSIWMLVETLFSTTALATVLTGWRHWRIDAAAMLVLAISTVPTIAFFVLWPLRPPLLTTYAESEEANEDSQAAPANPPVAPPE